VRAKCPQKQVFTDAHIRSTKQSVHLRKFSNSCGANPKIICIRGSGVIGRSESHRGGTNAAVILMLRIVQHLGGLIADIASY